MLTQEQINDALQKQIDELKKQGENQGKVLSAIGELLWGLHTSKKNNKTDKGEKQDV